MRTAAGSEGWRKVVLRSLPPPAWLASRGPFDETVVSSRVRWARNVRGFLYPHKAAPGDLVRLAAMVREALQPTSLGVQPSPTEAERDFLVSCRLISAEFPVREPGRLLALDPPRALSLMVNEEDHLRFQALTAGWSLREAHGSALAELAKLEGLEFQHTAKHGFLTASTANAGPAMRLSALVHLIGLAQTGRLTTVLKALATWDLVARGLFGESSRAVGAFFQVSAVHGRIDDFTGACEYLLREETEARQACAGQAEEALVGALRGAVESSHLALADALRLVSWVRWAVCDPSLAMLVEFDHRDVDRWTAQMEVHGTTDQKTAERHRAEFWRERLEPALLRLRS